MIGGRVLDAAALIAFASRTSVSAEALVWTAVEEGLVLVVPSSVVAAAWTLLAEKEHLVLDVLLQLPVTISPRAGPGPSEHGVEIRSTRTRCSARPTADGRW